MKALGVFAAEKQVRIVDHPAPTLGEGEVQLRMLDVGICGTDREIASFQYGSPPEGADYLVLGHEALGVVDAVGSGVSGFQPGTLAVPMVRRPCPHGRCVACRQQHQDYCYTGDYRERGIKQAHGYMTEKVVDEARYMVPVPDALREVGVLVEPLTIAEKAFAEVENVQRRLPWADVRSRTSDRPPHLRALVLGAGPVGLLGAMKLRAENFEVALFSKEGPDSPQAALVERIGGHYVSASQHEAKHLTSVVGPVDLVYEAVGATQVAFEVLHVLGPNAVFVFTGVPGRKTTLELDAATLMKRLVANNQVLFGSVNAARGAYEQAVRDLGAFKARWPEALGGLITGRFAMERHAEVLTGDVKGIKNVVALQ